MNPSSWLCGCLAGLAAMVGVSQPAPADTIVCQGVLGNSGAQGKDLVRFGQDPARGMGVACDRYGALWDRAGKGWLNRYAADGRLLAQYRIAPGEDGGDQIVSAGATVLLQIQGKLYAVDIDASPGSEARPLKIASTRLSSSSYHGRVAFAEKGRLYLLDPAAGRPEEIAALPFKDVQALEMGPDGTIYVQTGSKLHALKDGKFLKVGWPKDAPGERPQLLGHSWFGHAWHGTIRRFNRELQPEPGVVLGGASGSFIGHLEGNYELSNGRGLANLEDDLYAVSGHHGVMHLLRWHGDQRRFEIVRRIGALPTVTGLGLDRQGRVWCNAGSWAWEDHPDTPLRHGVYSADAPGIGQAVMLENDFMVAPGYQSGKPAFWCGPLDREVTLQRCGQYGGCDLRRGAVGSVVYRQDGRLLLLTVDAGGSTQAFALGGDGKWQANAGPVALTTSVPAKTCTSLALKDPDTLLAAADGWVIELARAQRNWKERRRWQAWGNAADERFGPQIYLGADAGRLWVADRARHRVVCLDLREGKPLAVFGAVDQPGEDLTRLTFPQVLIARGDRAVVFDSGNQRLVKLRLTAP